MYKRYYLDGFPLRTLDTALQNYRHNLLKQRMILYKYTSFIFRQFQNNVDICIMSQQWSV